MSHRQKLAFILILSSLFSFGLCMTRFFVTHSGVFLFLNWNLFLAFIPWLISTIAISQKMSGKWVLTLLIGSWLLFFPNCPYILTDLFHLRNRSEAPIWYDLVVILSYAWSGLLFGFVSLMDIEQLLRNYFSGKITQVTAALFLFMASFGVYLGRFLRWNSWDIISNPFGLFNDIFDRFANPLDHLRTWGVTVLMGILLNLMYLTLKALREQD